MVARKNQTRRVISELNDFVEGLVVKLAVNVTAELSEDTPKDTGWAASNWTPRVGQRTEQPFGSKKNVSEGAKVAGLAEVVTSYALPQLVHVTNPVYYILSLNDGTSTQAPRNFVQTSIAKAIKSVV